jgi:hypothetical protein
MTRSFAHDPAATIARSIPRDIGSKERGMSDLFRTNEVRSATADYEATAPLFLAIRRDLGSQP